MLNPLLLHNSLISWGKIGRCGSSVAVEVGVAKRLEAHVEHRVDWSRGRRLKARRERPMMALRAMSRGQRKENRSGPPFDDSRSLDRCEAGVDRKERCLACVGRFGTPIHRNSRRLDGRFTRERFDRGFIWSRGSETPGGVPSNPQGSRPDTERQGQPAKEIRR